MLYKLQPRFRLELFHGFRVAQLLTVHLEPFALRVRAVIVARPGLADGQDLLVDLV
jgi:hypothetical protein